MQTLRLSSPKSAIQSHTVISMGNSPVSEKRITIHHSRDDLRLIRAALRFAQVNSERPLTFDQDSHASLLIERITAELGIN